MSCMSRPMLLSLLASMAAAVLLAATLGSASAQPSRKDICTNMCDCTFECIDFCGAGRCPCPRLTQMKKACERACQHCKRLKISPKKDT